MSEKSQVQEFLKNKKLKIYVCGDEKNRSQDLFQQSAMLLLNAEAKDSTIYAEPAKNAKGVVDISLDEPVEGSKIEKSTTKSSRDFNELAQTLRELGNVTWIMDKDAISRTFALNPEMSKGEAFDKHMEEEFTKLENGELSKQLSIRDKQMLFDEVMSDKNNPFSLAIPSTTIEGNVGVINPADPDMPIHDMFFPYMKENGIKLEEYNQFINTHEAGHANDRRNHRNMFSDKDETNWKRHRTECVADTFATLMLARKTGNTEIGKLAGEVRIEYAVKGLAYIQRHVDDQKRQQEERKRQQEERKKQEEAKKAQEEKEKESETPKTAAKVSASSLSARLSKYEDKDFGKKGTYVGNPDLKIFIEQKKGKTFKNQEPSFVETIINRFGDSKSGFFRSPEDVLGSIFAYTTTPTVDATLKVAEEKLQDGSLQAMTTKDLYSLAEKLVDENTFSKERIKVMISSFMKGEATPEVDAIIKRREVSDLQTTNKKASSTRMFADEKEAYDAEFKGKIKSEANADIMNAVEQEKDVLREITPFEKDYKHAHDKINHLNRAYVEKRVSKEDVVSRILKNKNKHKNPKPVVNLIDKNNVR